MNKKNASAGKSTMSRYPTAAESPTAPSNMTRAGVKQQIAASAELVWDGQTVALRPSALVVDEGGSLRADVERVSPGAQQTRLVVQVAGLGQLEATAAPGVEYKRGQQVSLRLVPSSLALLEAP